MAEGWTSTSMLPRDGRPVIFTRSVNQAGNSVDLHSPEPGQPVVAGHLDPAGVLVHDKVLTGDEPEGGWAGWVPTHWRYPDEEQPQREPPIAEAPLDPPGDQQVETRRNAEHARLTQMRHDAEVAPKR